MTPTQTAVRRRHDRPLVLGHRGSPRTHGENTIDGLRAALAAGADGVEFDVRLAGDGVPIVAHDADLWRTHKERVRLASMPADHLPLPTLDHVLRHVGQEHPEATLDIELKEHLEPSVLGSLLDEAGWKGGVVVTSFRQQTVRAYTREGGWTVGLLHDDRRVAAEDTRDLLSQSEADLLGLRNPVFLRSVAHSMHDAGAALWVWTLNRSAHIRRAARLGVDAVITDVPHEAVAVLQTPDPDA